MAYSNEDHEELAPSSPILTPTSLDTAGKTDAEAESARKGRFLVYWMTTTSLSTLTSYTATTTLYSLTCTPSSFGIVNCSSK